MIIYWKRNERVREGRWQAESGGPRTRDDKSEDKKKKNRQTCINVFGMDWRRHTLLIHGIIRENSANSAMIYIYTSIRRDERGKKGWCVCVWMWWFPLFGYSPPILFPCMHHTVFLDLHLSFENLHPPSFQSKTKQTTENMILKNGIKEKKTIYIYTYIYKYISYGHDTLNIVSFYHVFLSSFVTTVLNYLTDFIVKKRQIVQLTSIYNFIGGSIHWMDARQFFIIAMKRSQPIELIWRIIRIRREHSNATGVMNDVVLACTLI